MSENPELERAEARFALLTTLTPGRVLRYSIHEPDLLEMRWWVFDRVQNKTIAYGRSPRDAVDAAITFKES